MIIHPILILLSTDISICTADISTSTVKQRKSIKKAKKNHSHEKDKLLIIVKNLFRIVHFSLKFLVILLKKYISERGFAHKQL